MPLGKFLDIAIASRFVIFDKNGEVIGSYYHKDDVPDHLKDKYITEVTSPISTRWYDGSGVMMIRVRF